MAEKERGKVKWFNNSKGYGFIERASGGDIFLHYSSIKVDGYRTVKEGQEVDVKVIEIKDGKLSLSIKALLENPEEPDSSDEEIPIPESQDIGTSLGDLLKGFKLS